MDMAELVLFLYYVHKINFCDASLFAKSLKLIFFMTKNQDFIQKIYTNFITSKFHSQHSQFSHFIYIFIMIYYIIIQATLPFSAIAQRFIIQATLPFSAIAQRFNIETRKVAKSHERNFYECSFE